MSPVHFLGVPAHSIVFQSFIAFFGPYLVETWRLANLYLPNLSKVRSGTTVGSRIWVKHVRCVGSDVSEHVVPHGRQPRYGQGSSHVPMVKPGATLGVMESKSRRPEYLKSRKIQVALASILKPGTYHSLGANLNIAQIDIAIGVDSKLIHPNLEACHQQCKALSGLQRTHIGLVVDQNFVKLYLREGDHSTANRKFTNCFKLSRKLQWMENTLYSLEQLADLSSGMNNFHVTLGWVGIFLVLALKSELKLATMKAFVCLGQLFVIQGDHETALNVFNIALDGFTFMNVHRWRADCIVRIAEIWEQKAEVAKSVEL
ncbi:hypothetical protein C8J57DRAFT_1239813 [Mycena rebaudengoi]|nr:hypothetical protein C8J57DRAFT_1239813 [Mycena rebaudengoi]